MATTFMFLNSSFIKLHRVRPRPDDDFNRLSVFHPQCMGNDAGQDFILAGGYHEDPDVARHETFDDRLYTLPEAGVQTRERIFQYEKTGAFQ